MKRVTLTTFLVFIFSMAFSQMEEKNQINLSNNFSVNDVYRFSELTGGGYVENGSATKFGVNYSRKIGKKLWLNLGFNYLRTSNNLDFIVYEENDPLLLKAKTIKTDVLCIPLKLRYDVNNWFYLKSGINYSNQLKSSFDGIIDNQTGIGASIACGFSLAINKSFYISLEPELEILSLLSLKDDVDYKQRFLLFGANFSIGYRF